MLKALIKQQFMSMLSRYGVKSKPGKSNKPYGYIILVAALMLITGGMFYAYAYLIAQPMAMLGMGWLYFVYAGILALFFAVVIGIFMAQSCLYDAKDNEFLLSLPIPSKYILLVRMIPLYAQNLLFEAVVLVPACICWCTVASITAGQVIIWLLMLVLQPFLAQFLTCLIGMLLALITSRMRDKTLATVILTVIFVVLYLIGYTQLMSNISKLVTDSAAIGENIKTYLYPFYAFGNACMGDFVGFAVVAGIITALFGGLYAVLAKTYIGLITGKRSAAMAKYDGRVEKPRSMFGALLRKELRRFFSCGIYFLNCGLGVVMLVIGSVFFVIKGGELIEMLGTLGITGGAVSLAACLMISFISSMDAVTAPSISLEGGTLWILQSTPADMWKVLEAKLALHYLVTAPAATVCTIVFVIVLKPSWLMILLMLLAPTVTVYLFGVIGLLFNLFKPQLKWQNETVVIKQSMSVLFTMLSAMVLLGALIGLYFALNSVLSAEMILLVGLGILAAVAVGLTVWLKRIGPNILNNI